MLTRSKTNPVPSEFLAQTGCVKGWKERAQQSKGVVETGPPCTFLVVKLSLQQHITSNILTT